MPRKSKKKIFGGSSNINSPGPTFSPPPPPLNEKPLSGPTFPPPPPPPPPSSSSSPKKKSNKKSVSKKKSPSKSPAVTMLWTLTVHPCLTTIGGGYMVTRRLTGGWRGCMDTMIDRSQEDRKVKKVELRW